MIPPLGFDGEGRTYRLNSDRVAVAVADALKAIKLIFVTVQDGLIHGGQLIRHMLPDELRDLIRDDPDGFAPGSCPRPRTPPRPARPACRGSTSSTAASTKVCSARCSPTTGIGTLIYANEYRTDPSAPARRTSAPSRC